MKAWQIHTIGVLVVLVLCVGAVLMSNLLGAGAFKRMTTLGGLFAICKPSGYDVVCFGDTSGHDGGVSCVPLSLAGGECK